MKRRIAVLLTSLALLAGPALGRATHGSGHAHATAHVAKKASAKKKQASPRKKASTKRKAGAAKPSPKAKRGRHGKPARATHGKKAAAHTTRGAAKGKHGRAATARERKAQAAAARAAAEQAAREAAADAKRRAQLDREAAARRQRVGAEEAQRQAWRQQILQQKPQGSPVTAAAGLPALPRPGWRLPPSDALAVTPLPPLALALPFRLDEKRLQHVVRLDGFAPVETMLARLPSAPIDRVLFADRFAALDRDGDGWIERDEWTGPRGLFDRLDRDGDGRLDRAELQAHDRTLNLVRRVDRDRYVAFQLLDVDGDGVLAPWEWTGDIELFFRLDTDGDGVLSPGEYMGLAPRAARVPVRLAWNGALDLDGDGVVEPSEWPGDPFRFARLDLDHDGRIERWEAVAGWLLRV